MDGWIFKVATALLKCVIRFLQLQKHDVFVRLPPAQPHLHLRQRGFIGAAAFHPHGHPEDPVTPAQRNHPGGRSQQQL